MENALMEEESYVVSGLVIDIEKGSANRVSEALRQIKGVEVHESHESKLVVTIEAETSTASADIAASFLNISGVQGMNLIYVNFEDDKELDWSGR